MFFGFWEREEKQRKRASDVTCIVCEPPTPPPHTCMFLPHIFEGARFVSSSSRGASRFSPTCGQRDGAPPSSPLLFSFFSSSVPPSPADPRDTPLKSPYRPLPPLWSQQRDSQLWTDDAVSAAPLPGTTNFLLPCTHHPELCASVCFNGRVEKEQRGCEAEAKDEEV